MAFVKLVVFGYLFLGVVYVTLVLYSRSIRRERLENEWTQHEPPDATDEDRRAFISDGLEQYSNSLRKRLILLVFIIPPIIVGTIIYLIN